MARSIFCFVEGTEYSVITILYLIDTIFNNYKLKDFYFWRVFSPHHIMRVSKRSTLIPGHMLLKQYLSYSIAYFYQVRVDFKLSFDKAKT